MAYWCDDEKLRLEQQRLDMAQEDARLRMEDEKKRRDAGLRTQEDEYMAWRETQAWEE